MRTKKILSIFFLIFFSNYIFSQNFNCYDLIESDSGVGNLYNEELDNVACSLQTLVTTLNNEASSVKSVQPFDILGCDLYPIKAYVNEDDGFEYLANLATEAIELSHDSYIMIIKYHKEHEVGYDVRFNFENLSFFDGKPTLEVQMFSESLSAKIQTHEDISENNANPEIDLLQYVIDYFNGDVNLNIADLVGYSYQGIDGVLTSELASDSHQGSYFRAKDALKIDGISLASSNVLPSTITLENNSYSIYYSLSSSANSFSAEELPNSDKDIYIDIYYDQLNNPDSLLIGISHFSLDLDEASTLVDSQVKEILNQGEAFGPDSEYSEAQDDGIDSKMTVEEWETWADDLLEQEINNDSCCTGECTDDDESVYSAACFGKSVSYGALDGMVGSIVSLYKLSRGSLKAVEATKNYMTDLGKTLINERSLFAVYKKVALDAFSSATKAYESFKSALKTAKKIYLLFANLSGEDLKTFAQGIKEGFLEFINSFIDGSLNSAFLVGKLGFEIFYEIVIQGFAAGGIVGIAAVFIGKLIKIIKTFYKAGKISIGAVKKGIGDRLIKSRTSSNASTKVKAAKCGIRGGGCFVVDTPVLMAGKSNQFSLRNSTRTMAVAASMPIIAVPIQEVQLLDYAVAHETVNSTYGLTASVDDDIYKGLLDKDPYTSDQQRKRDQYEINDTDWNEVVFEQVNGRSTGKLALHNDWINKNGYQVDAVVELNLPEQGISGQFKITCIKHIIPQRKPTDEDESDDYGYKPVTALFTHESNQVYNISFDNGEDLGVTYQHPIYSVTAGDWKLAGELEVGEQVLTKSWKAKVVSSNKKDGSETVYNLEIQELHNFLVAESGIVVHNKCSKIVKKELEDLGVGTNKHRDMSNPQKQKPVEIETADSDKIAQKYGKDKVEICYDDLGFPDFNDWVAKMVDASGNLFEATFEINMTGNNTHDFTEALDQLKDRLPNNSSFQNLSASKVPFEIDGIKYTFHHHQDGKTMQLVPSSINSKTQHVGGAAIKKQSIAKGVDLELPGPAETKAKYKTICN